MAPMEYSMAQKKTDSWKNLKKKISCQAPFNICFYWLYVKMNCFYRSGPPLDSWEETRTMMWDLGKICKSSESEIGLKVKLDFTREGLGCCGHIVHITQPPKIYGDNNWLYCQSEHSMVTFALPFCLLFMIWTNLSNARRSHDYYNIKN